MHEMLEVYADEDGETHFRRSKMEFELRDFTPPSQPLMISNEISMTTGVFFVAPPGWDDAFHATPRKQIGVVLSGAATVATTDGEIVALQAGEFLLLNDEGSKGHLTQVQGTKNFCVLLVGLNSDDA